MLIVCRQSSTVAKATSKIAADGKLSVSSKRETRSRRAEILYALGKSTTESDVTEGYSAFCCLVYFCYCCFLSLILGNSNITVRNIVLNV